MFGRGQALAHLAREVSRFGYGPGDRLRLFVAVVSLPLTERRGGRERRFRLTIAPDGYTVADRSDFNVMIETLADADFDFELGRPQTILDAGAHAGLFSLYLHDRFPDARILALEPSPKTFARLEENVGGVPGVAIEELALGGADATARFREAKQSWGSALDSEGTVTVTTVSMATLMERAGLSQIDLLKVDIEGAEWSVFRSDADFHGASHVIGELHDQGEGWDRFYERFPSYTASVLRVFPNSQLFHLCRRVTEPEV